MTCKHSISWESAHKYSGFELTKKDISMTRPRILKAYQVKIDEQDHSVAAIPQRNLCNYRPNKQPAEVKTQAVQYMHRWQLEGVESQTSPNFQAASDLLIYLISESGLTKVQI